MMTVIYDLSTYGRTIIINEGLDEMPVLRVIFIMLIILATLLFKFNEALLFWSIWLDTLNKRYLVVHSLYLFYTFNSVFHTIQSADSIARPVDYYEPKFMYQKYIFTSMELPFIFNLLTIILGYFGFTQLLMAVFKGSDDLIQRKCRLLLFYIIFSMLTLFHYRQEPPHSYSKWINFIILGEAINGLLVTIAVTYITYLNSKKAFHNKPNTRDINNLIHINENYIQNSDDEEIETFNKNKVQMARQRSRSRTPTKTTEL